MAGNGGADVDVGVRDGVVQIEGEKTTVKAIVVVAAKIGKASWWSIPQCRCSLTFPRYRLSDQVRHKGQPQAVR